MPHLKVTLSESSFNDYNIINEIKNRATEKRQGADAILTKYSGRSKKVFLTVDNHQILLKEGRSRKTFVRSDYKTVEFPAIS